MSVLPSAPLGVLPVSAALPPLSVLSRRGSLPPAHLRVPPVPSPGASLGLPPRGGDSGVDFKVWRDVLASDRSPEALSWLLHWSQGWPELEGASRGLLWDLLATTPLRWSAELLVEAFGSWSAEGPPAAWLVQSLLEHPLAPLDLFVNVGFTARGSYRSENRKAQRADRALVSCWDAWCDSSSPAGVFSELVLGVARRLRPPADLLAVHRKWYDWCVRSLADPAWGGSSERLETFLVLFRESSVPVEVLVGQVSILFPSALSRPLPPVPERYR